MLIAFLILPYSCEKDDIINSKEQTFKPKVIIQHTSLAKAKHNQKIALILNNNQSFTLNRTTNDHESFLETFILDTIHVKYIEGPVSHSYTFALIERNQDSTLINNLVVAKHDEMDNYIALHFSYQLTSNELLNLKNGIYPQEFQNKPIIEEIQNFDFSSTGVYNRAGCVTYNTIYYDVPCSHPICQSAHESSPCQHPDQQTITVTVISDCPNSPNLGDGNSSDSSSGSGSSGGGGGGINWGGNNNSTTQNNDPGVLDDGPLIQIHVPLRSKVRTDLIDELDTEDLRFLDAYPHIEIALNTYLGNQQINPDANHFVKWSIDYLQNLYLLGTLLNRPIELNLFNSIVNSNLNNQDIINLLAFHEMAEEAIEDGGEVDFEDLLIVDSTFKNNQKAKCVYDRMKSLSGSVFSNLLSQFDNSNNAKLTLKVANIPQPIPTAYFNAKVLPRFGGGSLRTFDIVLDEQFVQNASLIEIALTLVHEMIHAEIMERCIQLGIITGLTYNGNWEASLNFSNGTITSIDVPSILFAMLISNYSNYFGSTPLSSSNWQHDLYTVTNYRAKIAENIAQVHPLLNDPNNPFESNLNSGAMFNLTMNEYFNLISWLGLEETQDFNNLSSLEQTKKVQAFNQTEIYYNRNCN